MIKKLSLILLIVLQPSGSVTDNINSLEFDDGSEAGVRIWTRVEFEARPLISRLRNYRQFYGSNVDLRITTVLSKLRLSDHKLRGFNDNEPLFDLENYMPFDSKDLLLMTILKNRQEVIAKCGRRHCNSDRDCPHGYVCVGSVCREIEHVVCGGDFKCPRGYVCLEGECFVKYISSRCCPSFSRSCAEWIRQFNGYESCKRGVNMDFRVGLL